MQNYCIYRAQHRRNVLICQLLTLRLHETRIESFPKMRCNYCGFPNSTVTHHDNFERITDRHNWGRGQSTTSAAIDSGRLTTEWSLEISSTLAEMIEGARHVTLCKRSVFSGKTEDVTRVHIGIFSGNPPSYTQADGPWKAKWAEKSSRFAFGRWWHVVYQESVG